MSQLRYCGLIGLACVSAGVTPAPAQQQTDALEEVVVTAEKRQTSLQDTPIAIQALDAAQLDRQGVTSTLDLQRTSPGMVISTNTADAEIVIRGIGTNFGGDQSVAVHVDGVYQVTTQAALQELLDIDRIEVLKGPQGTLYGRNATGGVINFISKQPSNELQAAADLQFGNFKAVRARGMLNIPLDDRLALRVSAVESDHDGYRRNPYLGTRIDDEHVTAGRAQLLFKADTNLKMVLAANYSREDDSRTLGFKVDPNVYAPQVALGGLLSPDPNVIYSDKRSIQHFTQDGVSLSTTWDLSAVSLKSISAFQQNHQSQDIDVDGTQLDYFDSILSGTQINWWSQELQALSNTQGPASWIGGLYYLGSTDRNRGMFTTPLFDSLGIGNGPIGQQYDQRTSAWAAFGQGTYETSATTRATLGARYSRETKDFTQYKGGLIANGFDTEASRTWNAFTPRFEFDWRPRMGQMLYVSATRGFKSGGFNESAQESFNPEFVWSYELGWRSSAWDERLRMNATAFFYDYRDLQVNQALAAPDPQTGAVTVVGNAATARVKGLELEGTVLPLTGLRLGAYVSLLDARYQRYETRDTEQATNAYIDLSGNRLPRAPKLSASLTALYSWKVTKGLQAHVSADAYHQSLIYFDAYNALNDEFSQQHAYTTYNADIGVEGADGRWHISAYGRNLSNLVYKENIIRAIGFFGQLDLLAPPRTYGVEIGYRFN